MGGIAANPTPLIFVNNTKMPCLHLKRKSLMLTIEAVQEGKQALSILTFLILMYMYFFVFFFDGNKQMFSGITFIIATKICDLFEPMWDKRLKNTTFTF